MIRFYSLLKKLNKAGKRRVWNREAFSCYPAGMEDYEKKEQKKQEDPEVRDQPQT